MTPEGEITLLDTAAAKRIAARSPFLVCHAPYMRQRLDADDLDALDVLELFAFVHPAKFCVPTPAGIAKALGQTAPDSLEDYPLSLLDSVTFLLEDLATQSKDKEKILAIAETMGLNGRGWPWTPHIFAAFSEK